MSFLKLSHIHQQIKQSKFTLRDINISLEKGKIMALVGESGSGKTSLLRLLSGLEIPDSGYMELNQSILFDAHKFISAEKRNIAYVFQEYALFPHLTVAENIKFGIKKSEDKKAILEEMLSLVHLNGYEKRYPSELSGGEQQRIALARALATQPQLLLLDEPFSNLDVLRKDKLKYTLKSILKKTQATVIFVTHDTQEALFLADQIAVMQDGKILQQGSPEKIYTLPISQYVASFFGKSNFFFVDLTLDNYNLPFNFPLKKVNADKHKRFLLSIRPHDFRIHAAGKIQGTILQIDFLGNYFQLKVEVIHDQKIHEFTMHSAPDTFYQINDSIAFDIQPEKVHCIFELEKPLEAIE